MVNRETADRREAHTPVRGRTPSAQRLLKVPKWNGEGFAGTVFFVSSNAGLPDPAQGRPERKIRNTVVMATADQARPSEGAQRERQVRRIFSEIAPRYDLLNHLLSLNVDRGWRRRAVDGVDWEGEPEGAYLDACAGTFDLSLELAGRSDFRGKVLASDFARPMLLEGLPKISGSPVLPVCGDTLRLPFPDAFFEGRRLYQ